jgi:hypothetical protein
MILIVSLIEFREIDYLLRWQTPITDGIGKRRLEWKLFVVLVTVCRKSPERLPSEQGFSLCKDSEWESQEADEGRAL